MKLSIIVKGIRNALVSLKHLQRELKHQEKIRVERKTCLKYCQMLIDCCKLVKQLFRHVSFHWLLMEI